MPTTSDTALLAELRGLEVSLLSGSIRRKRDAAASLLTEDFREFGSSGRIYTRGEILDALEQEETHEISGVDFALQALSDDAALLTYTSVKSLAATDPVTALRSSLWVRREGCWQMLFHQGTRIP